MPEDKKQGLSIDVCFSPLMLNLFEYTNRVVVIIDILRFSSTLCTALEHGAEKVIPVMTLEESMKYRGNGYLFGAERNGERVDGYEFGNSPFQYMDERIKGKKIVLTTTNGTRAIMMTRDAYKIVIGSFLNLDALISWLRNQQKDILLVCAAWKDKFNLEDTLFAGALIHYLQDEFFVESDAAIAAEKLFTTGKADLLAALKDSSHFKRLKKLGAQKDIDYCLTANQTNLVPVWDNEGLIPSKE